MFKKSLSLILLVGMAVTLSTCQTHAEDTLSNAAPDSSCICVAEGGTATESSKVLTVAQCDVVAMPKLRMPSENIVSAIRSSGCCIAASMGVPLAPIMISRAHETSELPTILGLEVQPGHTIECALAALKASGCFSAVSMRNP